MKKLENTKRGLKGKNMSIDTNIILRAFPITLANDIHVSLDKIPLVPTTVSQESGRINVLKMLVFPTHRIAPVVLSILTL